MVMRFSFTIFIFFLLLSFSIAFSFRSSFFVVDFLILPKAHFMLAQMYFAFIFLPSKGERELICDATECERDGGCRNQSGGWRMASGSAECFWRRKAGEVARYNPKRYYTTHNSPTRPKQNRTEQCWYLS